MKSEQQQPPRIWVDFNNGDPVGGIRLNSRGTITDIEAMSIKLIEGLKITIYSYELEADAAVHWLAEENTWTALPDWNAIRRLPGDFEP